MATVLKRLYPWLQRATGAIEAVPLPTHGVWETVGLTRGQFIWILIASILLFVFLDGPAWRSVHAAHTSRIVSSYALIPLLVSAAQWRNNTFRLRSWIEASVLLALIKLLVTAILLIAFALLA